MTCARSEIVDATEVSIYHCVSRCVRRAFLCGRDSFSGRSFDHRKKWIRRRLCHLVSIFAVEVVAYAVMSNHLHSLLQLRPDLVNSWTPEEVARRWRQLFPLRRTNGKAEEPNEAEIHAIVAQPDKVRRYRERLGSISWFNRCLNENIARRANEEDDCTGRFWEGRFKCQRVYDLAGALACAAYIELNPIRAGIAKTPEGSDHTSIQDRIHAMARHRPARCADWANIPLISIESLSGNTLTTEQYVRLVDETGRQIRKGKHSIPTDLAPILERINIRPERWMEITEQLGRRFRRVVGPTEFFELAARRAKKYWFQGIRASRRLFGPSPARRIV